MIKKFAYSAMAIIFIFTSSGCATVFHGTSTTVRINSVPPGATAIVDGKTVITPGKITLKNNQLYNVIFKKDGYEDKYFTIDKQQSGWMWTNVLLVPLFGIGIATAFIDTRDGGAYKLVPSNVNVTLTSKQERK